MGSKIAEKLDKIVVSMREELDKHDGSTIQAIYSNAKEGFSSIKRSLSRSEKANELADDIKKLGEDFVSAIKDGDKKLSDKILKALEKKSKEYKKEKDADEKAATATKAKIANPKATVNPKNTPKVSAKPKSASKAAKPKTVKPA